MSTLPHPDVQVNDTETTIDVTIVREPGKERAYRGYGGTTNEKVKDVIKKILDDPYSAEWLPK